MRLGRVRGMTVRWVTASRRRSGLQWWALGLGLLFVVAAAPDAPAATFKGVKNGQRHGPARRG